MRRLVLGARILFGGEHRGAGIGRLIVGMGSDVRVAPEEWDSVLAATDGPQLVVGGPGTGKTRFLVARVAHLVASGIAKPEEILVLSFSRRSAADIRDRIARSIDGSFTQINCSTFHSFASRLLESQGGAVLGWDSMPALLTGPEQVQLVSELLSESPPEVWPPQFQTLLSSRTFAVDVTDFLLRARERRLGSDDIRHLVPAHLEWAALPDFIDTYHQALASRHRIDYGTLLDTAVTVLSDPEASASLASQYRYVLVDEYQDTSPAQAALLQAFSIATPNLTVTGDPYQSIYSFRGASLDNIAQFPSAFAPSDGSGVARIVLTTSMRVPAEIMRSALRLTSGAELPGSSGPVIPASHPGSVDAYVFDQTSAEADWIASEVERLHLLERIPYARIAVLLRTKRHLVTELSRALGRRDIPHDPPDRRLVDHPAIQIIGDVVTVANLSAVRETPSDPGLGRALRRLLLGPLFRVPLATERDLVREQQRTGRPWTDILETEVPETTDLVQLAREPDWAVSMTAVEGFWHVWDRLRAVGDLAARPAMTEFRAAWTAFSQALERQAERDSTVTIVDYFRLAESDDFEAQPLLSHSSADDQITLTTLHQAKGLEFDVVFIADAADSVFPDLRRGVSLLATRELDPDIGADHAAHLRFRLQEEIRLAYTAMTRASRRVVWTATRAGIDEQERRPSRFMVSILGLTEIEELQPPSDYEGPPVSIAQTQAMLRRIVADPAQLYSRRLAAVSVLTEPNPHWDVGRFAGLRSRGPNTGVMAERFRLSPSQAESYDKCPRRYVMERRLGVGDGSSSYAQYGSLIHRVLELAERQALDRDEPRSDLESAISILAEVWSTEADFGSAAYNAKWFTKGLTLLDRMYREWPNTSKQPILLEHHLTLDVAGTQWQGYADRIERRSDGSLGIVDYKTSATVPATHEMERSVQLGFYVLAAMADDALDGDRIGAAETWYPAGRKKGWIRSFDLANLGDVKERIEAITAAIRSEHWTPTPGDACKNCAVRIVCPAQPEGREAFT